jgi:hypothetical protein
MVQHVFCDPLASGKVLPSLEDVNRCTRGDLEALIQKAFSHLPGATRLIDAFLARARELVDKERNVRRRSALLQVYTEFVGSVGNVCWMDVAFTPWNVPAARYEELDAATDRKLLHGTLHFCPTNGGTSIHRLAGLFRDIAASERHRLGQPLDPSRGVDIESVLPLLRNRLKTTLSFLDSGGRRYLDPGFAAESYGKAMREYSAGLLPILKRVEQILKSDRVDRGQLQRELAGLYELIVRMGTRDPHTTLRTAGERAHLFGQDESKKLMHANGVCYAMLNASLAAMVDEGLLYICFRAIDVWEIDRQAVGEAVETVARRIELVGAETRREHRALSPSDRRLIPENIVMDLSVPEVVEGRVTGLRGRWEVAMAHPEHSELLVALVCRDALQMGYGSCAGVQSTEEVERHVRGLNGEAQAVVRRLFNVALFMEQGARGSVRLMESLLHRAFAAEASRDKAAASAAGAELGAAERAAAPRRQKRRSPPPASAAAAAAEEPEPVQAPQIAAQAEKVDIAALHDTASRLGREDLAHCLLQLRERLMAGKGSVRDEVNLLRQTIEFALRHSMDDPHQAKPGHNLARLAGSLAEVERVGDVVRHHSEVIFALAQGNLCANYTEEAKRLDSDARTRWLTAHVEGVFPGARGELVEGTFRLVHDLLKVADDPKFSLESAPAVDFQIESAEKERLPASPPPEAAAPAAVAAEPPQSVTNHPEALQAIASMRSWIQLHLTMPGSPRRSDALGHALAYLDELEGRLQDFTRLTRLSDSCWGEINWAHRLVKELLAAALHQRHPDRPRSTENNPRILAAELPSAPEMPPWIGMVHGMVSFPGRDWQGPLADTLRQADAESGLGGRLVLDFEAEYLYPLLDVAWQLVQQQFKPE